MSRAVLDASAMVAFIRGEPGGDIVDGYVGYALASAVNVAETAARLVDLGLSLTEVRQSVAHMFLDIVPFDEEQALATAASRSATRHRGLSLGDRACLELATRRGLPAVTADRAWAELDVDVAVRLIRE
ncbi:MAG: type II toxin-antitoxin system VapC family toxin [Chloroflexi bacterium]|nr:type II toxin-antitoxin system VapC family toxin [Chloroflexota bacterium]